jgi:O-antigen/teichoic acid export membrane protein
MTSPLTKGDAARIGGGGGFLLFGTVLGRGARLLVRIAIGRLLGAGTLGLYDLGWTVSNIAGTFVPAGLPVAIIRFGTPLWRSDRAALRLLVRRVVSATVILGLIAGAAVYLASRSIAVGIYRQPELAHILRALSPIVPLSAAVLVLTAATRVTGRMRYTALARDLVQPPFHLLVFAVLWAAGLRLDAALAGAVISYGVALLLAGRFAVRLMPKMDQAPQRDVPGLGKMFKFSLPVALSGMLMSYLVWIDRLVVGYFRPPAELGAYTAAAQFAVLFGVIRSVLTTVFSPMLVDLRERDEHRRVAELFSATTKWNLYLTAPLVIFFLVAPTTALVGAFGEEFRIGASALVLLSAGQLVSLLAGPVGRVLSLTGHERQWLLLTFVAIGLNLMLDILWLPRYGIAGAAAASLLAMIVLNGGGAWRLYREHGIWSLDRRFWKLAPPRGGRSGCCS